MCTTTLHDRGVFGAHCVNKLLASCGKDSTVAVSALGDASIEVTHRYEQRHDGVVKTVRLHGNKLASAGNDRCIVVGDVRSPVEHGALRIDDAHAFAINALSFHPDGNLMVYMI